MTVDMSRLLLIKMSSLGDIVHALPTLYAIRKNWPQAHITWAVHEQFKELLPGKPWLDEVIYIDKKQLKKPSYLWHLRKELHKRHFTSCLDLQCLAKSALVAMLSGAPVKYGYWELREGSSLIEKPLVGSHQYDHVIERYLDAVRALGGQVEGIHFPLPVHKEAKESLAHLLISKGYIAGSPYVVLAPGARWILKEWPPLYFAELAKRIMDTKRFVFLIGSLEDTDKSRLIEEHVQSPYLINLSGHTSLAQLIELIKGAAFYISADTGPLHIANAANIPLIGLYGTTSPKRTGPYGGAHVHVIVSPTSKATPESPLVDDPLCMQQIDVNRVWYLYQTCVNELGM